ncbi:MAG: exodeoxyribonuclease VII large subunit [Firmicutes bacterium]|nr:exodeoxyribonuclease VII large subunit [Bacillota bacterium]
MQKQLSVSQLNRYIKGVFEDELILHNLNIDGEVIEIKNVAGVIYFVLKDEDCILNCVSFNQIIGIEVGNRVIAFGKIEFYSKSGRVSFIAKSVTLSGEGLLLARQRKLKEKLQNEGIFSNNRILPKFIKKVALITSEEGAVLHDFISIINRLAEYIEVVIFGVKVQGNGASEQIINVMRDITCDYDVIILARGGGSAIDLSEFNKEELARSIHASKIMVVSAIGHETDYTFCDFAADMRAGTPSMAAEIIAGNNNSTINKFINLSIDNTLKINALYNLKHKTLIKQAKIAQNNAESVVYTFKRKLLHKEILKKIEYNINNKESDFKILITKIEAINPLKLLTDGYCKITKDNKIIASVKNLNEEDNLNIFISDGQIQAKIEKILKK